jgi:hypothetical protein
VLALGCLPGCGDDDEPSDAGGEAGAGGDGAWDDCPDADDPAVHYRTRDIAECPIEELVCTMEQTAFHNACGCGCIDKDASLCELDPSTVDYVSEDPAECGDLLPSCPLGQRPFNNACGCGCVEE